MDKGFFLTEIRIKGLVNVRCRHNHGHGQISAGQPLGKADEIRGDAGMFTGKKRSGPSITGRNLIGDQMNLVLIAQLTQFFQVNGRIDPHTGGTLEPVSYTHLDVYKRQDP